MASFSIAEWAISLLIVALILGTRKLVSRLAQEPDRSPSLCAADAHMSSVATEM
jgi:hypothetical protein